MHAFDVQAIIQSEQELAQNSWWCLVPKECMACLGKTVLPIASEDYAEGCKQSVNAVKKQARKRKEKGQ